MRAFPCLTTGLLAAGIGLASAAFAESGTPAPRPGTLFGDAQATLESATSSEASEDGGRPSATLDVTAASKYLFQGIDYSEGKAVIQPNVAASWAGFALGAWANSQSDLGVVNEIDVTCKYNAALQALSITPGYMYLAYPHREGWSPSQELFLDLALESELSPTLSLHYDFDAGDGLYATLGVSREIRAPVTLAANLFYQSRYYEVSGFPAAEFKASAGWSLGAVTATPSISYFSTWNNRDFRDAAAVPSTWLFSLNVARSISF